ncbi:MAG: hypothetical protein HQ557_03065 [Bacteroidetes bacterium]|nr:hypothetical protein [Bacteroidota bacterium]
MRKIVIFMSIILIIISLSLLTAKGSEEQSEQTASEIIKSSDLIWQPATSFVKPDDEALSKLFEN